MRFLLLLITVLFLAACSSGEPEPVSSAQSAPPQPATPVNMGEAEPSADAEVDSAEMRNNPGGSDPRPIAERVTSGFVSPGRPRADIAAHPNRKPGDVLEWAGVGEAMNALDVAAYGGYYTENLSWAVGPEGWVVSHNTDAILGRSAATGETWDRRLAGNRLANVDTFVGDYSDIATQFDEEFDVVTLINTFHDTYNFAGEEAALALLQSLHSVIVPGGFLLFIDHEGVAGNDNASLHRIDPAVAREMLQQAGFEITAESSILNNPDDDRGISIFDEQVRGTTSRFILKASKAESI